MGQNLRLVILDYPKLMLDQDAVRRAFADMIVVKQKNFARTSESYVSMGPLDMISTHFLIYDQTQVYEPRLAGGFRCCWGNRTRYHKLSLPIEEYITYAPIEYRKKFEEFRSTRPVIVDGNAWFVDPEYTYSKSGLRLSELIYTAFVQFIVRKGFDHYVGAANEKYKASRWAMPTGYTRDGMIFTHPKVPDPHKLLLFEHLNYEWLYDCSMKYAEFISQRVEVKPETYPTPETTMSVEDAVELIQARKRSDSIAA